MKFITSTTIIAACWAAMLASPVALGAAQDELTVRLPSFVTDAASLVRAEVRIPRDGDNRLLRITMDSGSFYRSSDVPLDGERAPQTHTIVWHALPPGAYDVTIELVGTTRVKRVVRREFHVLGFGNE